MNSNRPFAYWVFCVFLAVTLVLLLLGQTTALFAYDFAVGLGLQESVEEVGLHGVEVNRAFGAGDTLVYLPIVAISLFGLLRRRRWALPLTAAALGVSAYWAVTCAAMLVFLETVPGYTLEPGVEYAVVLGGYTVVGAWGLWYLATRGDRLLGGGS